MVVWSDFQRHILSQQSVTTTARGAMAASCGCIIKYDGAYGPVCGEGKELTLAAKQHVCDCGWICEAHPTRQWPHNAWCCFIPCDKDAVWEIYSSERDANTHSCVEHFISMMGEDLVYTVCLIDKEDLSCSGSGMPCGYPECGWGGFEEKDRAPLVVKDA